MNRIKTFLWLMIVVFMGGLVTGCAGTVSSAATPLSITLHAQDIRFDITHLTVKANQTVILTYVNEGVIDHAFAIDGLVEEQQVKPDQTVVFSFVPKKVGQFRYYCAMPGHEMAGMIGTLVVQP